MNLTLEAYGPTALQTNATTGARVAAAEFFVNFDQFGASLQVYCSALAQIVAAPTQPAIIEAWASATEGDVTGTGTLLGVLTINPAGTGGVLVGFDVTTGVVNPGGEKYVIFTTRAGLSGATPETLSFRGLLLALSGPDGNGCGSTTTTPLVALRLGAKVMADKVNDASVTDDSWDQWINQGIESLWTAVVAASGDRFFSQADFTLAGATEATSFLDVTTIAAKDFRHVRYVEVDPDTTIRKRVPAYNFSEKDAQAGGPGWRVWDQRRRHRLMGNKLTIAPYENSAGKYRLYYVPKTPKLVAKCDALPEVLEQWNEYPMLFAAMKGLNVEETDDSPLATRLATMKAEMIDTLAPSRDDESNDVIADVEGDNDGGDWTR